MVVIRLVGRYVLLLPLLIRMMWEEERRRERGGQGREVVE